MANIFCLDKVWKIFSRVGSPDFFRGGGPEKLFPDFFRGGVLIEPEKPEKAGRERVTHRKKGRKKGLFPDFFRGGVIMEPEKPFSG